MFVSHNKAPKAQGVLEYTVFLCVVLSALLIMQFVVKRSYQGRIKQEADSIGSTYSPGHTVSESAMTTHISTRSYTGGKIPRGDPLRDVHDADLVVADGMSVSLSNTATTFKKDEQIDSIKSED